MSTINLMSTRQVREGTVEYDGPAKVTGPEDVVGALHTLLDGRDREVFGVLALDTANHVIGINVVSIGVLDAAPVHPREVFRWAIHAGAASIIAFHNHPSGKATPSKEDRAATTRLRAAGELLAIRVLDHVVLGADGTWASAS